MTGSSIGDRFKAGEVGRAEALDYLCSFMSEDDAAKFRRGARRGSPGRQHSIAALFSNMRQLDMPNDIYPRLNRMFYGEIAKSEPFPESAIEWRLGRV